uniref:Uncharacterized protein n=1 Tax=Triticum urartu TaxID=4572 RepID=A0A8R7PLB4_TRIUA
MPVLNQSSSRVTTNAGLLEATALTGNSLPTHYPPLDA